MSTLAVLDGVTVFTFLTARLPWVPGSRSMRMGLRCISHSRVPSTWAARRRSWDGEVFTGLWDSWGEEEEEEEGDRGQADHNEMLS